MTKLTLRAASWSKAIRLERALRAQASADGVRISVAHTGRTGNIITEVMCPDDWVPTAKFVIHEVRAGY